ncbi:MAG: hypothetical protein KDG50_08850 [Chromatiales bacterium]|nr:hypothetical protein [Chromatiales bacterium]
MFHRSRRSFAVLGALLASLVGCERPPREVPVSELRFPVVLVFGDTEAQINVNAQDLALMHMGHYTHMPEQMRVIDAQARVFEMRDIQGEHGGLWMMLNPTGLMPISFRLIPARSSGLEAARGVILGCEFFDRVRGADETERVRDAVRRASDMASILRAIVNAPEPGQ